MCTGLEIAAIGMMLGAGATGIQQSAALNKQKDAGSEAQRQAQATAAAQDQAYNAANKKRPNVGAMQAANMQAATMGGAGSTMLTGPAGIDPSALSLGKTTLLGG